MPARSRPTSRPERPHWVRTRSLPRLSNGSRSIATFRSCVTEGQGIQRRAPSRGLVAWKLPQNSHTGRRGENLAVTVARRLSGKKPYLRLDYVFLPLRHPNLSAIPEPIPTKN